MLAKKHHRLGHYLFISGIFILLITVAIISPLNDGVSRAFGVSDITRLSNQAREQLNHKPLNTNTRLMNAAQMKAEDMAKQKFFAHTAPDGKLAWDYLKEVGYAYEVAGENLAITNQTAEAVVNGWLNSITHRENLLNDQFIDFGIGMAYFGDYKAENGTFKDTYVIVALYGRPSSAQNPAATTVPAGTSSALTSKIPILPVAAVAITSLLLILAGIYFEIRHIKHLHQSKSFA